MFKQGCFLVLSFLVLFPLSIKASTVAIIDSGVDVKHTELESKIWINAGEIADNGRDEDGNGFQDDVYGWNFAENNNLVIDYKYLGTFSNDPRKFFEIQAKSFLGTVTEEEKAWVKEKREDENFIKEMGKFGNFVHGTHVAGIAVANNIDTKILSVKLIPTEVKPFLAPYTRVAKANKEDNFRLKLVKSALSALADAQMKMMTEIGHYINGHKVNVANGSFGTGFDQAKMITNLIFKGIFFREPTDDESNLVTKHFMDELISKGRAMVDAAKDTLFVFAAGNSGMDNDKYPTSPTNIKSDNVISVAASFNRNSLAVFSNFGKTMVDLAAPGVIIDSQIPGNERLQVSGTSQAAPYIASVASRVKESNKSLTPADIKKILIETVDAKDFLTQKVLSGGIVNRQRAIRAGELTNSLSIQDAINQAKETTPDVIETESVKFIGDKSLILPLPSMFN